MREGRKRSGKGNNEEMRDYSRSGYYFWDKGIKDYVTLDLDFSL
jgi:hypothetical protein